MKKTISQLLVIMLVLLLTACGSAEKGTDTSVSVKENAAENSDADASTAASDDVGNEDVTVDEQIQGFEYGSRSELILSLEKGLFSVGTPETVSFTVQCPEESETVRILDENDRELAAVENKGLTSVTGSLVIDESEPRFGSLHAVSGNLESPEIYYTVAPEITDEMAETLVDVCLDVRDHLAAEYPEGPYTNETLSAVQRFLNEDDRVKNCTIDGQMLLFSTIDGLMGMVDMSEEKWTSRGAVTAEQAFALSREGLTDEETVIPVRAAVTNSRYLYVSPKNDDEIMRYGDSEPQRMMEHTASVFGANYECLEGADAEAVLRDGSFTDAGFLTLSTHGATYSRSNGGRLLLLSIHDYSGELVTVGHDYDYSEEEKNAILDSLTKHESEDSEGTTELYFGSPEHAENCNMIMCITNNKLSPRLTATGLENSIGEKLFDNTVVFLAICCSDEDKQLLQFLADHGASVIFTGAGSMDVTRCSEAFYMIDTLMTVQNDDGSYPSFKEAGLYPTQKELRAFQKQWDEIDIINEDSNIAKLDWYSLMQDPEENEEVILQKIKFIAEKRQKEEGLSKEDCDLLNWQACRNYKEMWRSINESYLSFVNWRNAYIAENNGAHDEGVEKILSTDSPETLMKDYIEGNLVKCYLFAEEKTLGGTGTMSGSVLSRKYHQPVADAEIQFLRWIDHDYRLVKTCTTDADGHYVMEDLPFGIYAVKASKENEAAHVCFTFTKDQTEAPDLLLTISDEDLYYSYLKDTYGTEESDLVSAYIMDFDFDGRKDLLTVTKGRVILANTPLGAFDLYDGNTEAATLDLTMYQLDEENNVVKTGAILGAGTIEGHSEGKMSVSIVLQDGTPYICGYSENEDNTTYGAQPYVIYEVIEGGGFQYDYVSGITWGQYVMGKTDDKDPNKIAKTYGLDITGTQLSDRANYGGVLCEATANNRQGPGPIVANDYTGVMEGMENGYEAVKEQLDAMHEKMVLDAKAFEERQEKAASTEGLFEIFTSELSAAGITPVLKEYRTIEDIVLGIYKCQDVDMYVSIENESGKLTEIELTANGFPVPDSWYPVKDAVLTSSFSGLDQSKIGGVLGHTPANASVSGLDAGPATILMGNAGTIVLRITY